MGGGATRREKILSHHTDMWELNKSRQEQVFTVTNKHSKKKKPTKLTLLFSLLSIWAAAFIKANPCTH